MTSWREVSNESTAKRFTDWILGIYSTHGAEFPVVVVFVSLAGRHDAPVVGPSYHGGLQICGEQWHSLDDFAGIGYEVFCGFVGDLVLDLFCSGSSSALAASPKMELRHPFRIAPNDPLFLSTAKVKIR